MLKHFISANGYVGDVMPYYENGTLHLFYLRAPFEPKRKTVENLTIGHASSVDFLKWKELPDVMQGDQPYDNFGCHTGSVIKKGNEYLFFYSGVPDNPWRGEDSSRIGICVARSGDLITWEKDAANPVIQPDERFPKVQYRDPYVLYWPEKKLYLMSVTTKIEDANGRFGAVVMHTSPDLENWSKGEVIWNSGQRWEPECTCLLQLEGRWYLTYQAWVRGTYMDAHVFYLVSDSPYGPWKQIGDGRLDWGNLWAGKPLVVEDRILYFANIPTREGRSDYGNWQWGGHLGYVRRLLPQADSSLRIVATDELIQSAWANRESLTVTPIAGKWKHSGESWLAEAENCALGILASRKAKNVTCELVIENIDADQAGVIVRMPAVDDNSKGMPCEGYKVCVDFAENVLKVISIEREEEMERAPLAKAKGHTIRIVLDEDILEIFADERVAIITRLYGFGENTDTGIFASGGRVRFSSGAR